MKTYPTLKQRVTDLKAFIEINNLKIKDIAERSNINYSSLTSQLHVNKIGDKRVAKLEQVVIEMAKENVERLAKLNGMEVQ